MSAFLSTATPVPDRWPSPASAGTESGLQANSPHRGLLRGAPTAFGVTFPRMGEVTFDHGRYRERYEATRDEIADLTQDDYDANVS